MIYSFRNKLDCFPLNARLGWKGLQGTNNLAYYENLKIKDVRIFITLGTMALFHNTFHGRNL
jgi:hypothetical protein